MTDPEPNRSSRILGQLYNLTAPEMNFLLREEGFLDGEPGNYSLAPKGRKYADEQLQGRRPGGYAFYNPSWETRTWDPSITAELDISEERKQQIREAAQAARRQKSAARAVQAAADVGVVKSSETDDSGVDALKVAVAVALTAVSIYGIKTVAPHLRALWTDKAAPRLRKPEDVVVDGAKAEAPEEEDPDA